MEHAVEQRQLNTNWEYAQFETAPSVQTLPWLVNTFFLKEEGLLPRADWNNVTQSWDDDPYNVPEMPGVYPEPSNWGILPAYGLYARHVDGLTIENLKLSWEVEDGRHAMVFDDASHVTLDGIEADAADGVSRVALVTNHFRRHTNQEYVPDLPYFMTTVSDISVPQDLDVSLIDVRVPAPGTPQDSLYPYPTLPIPENGYYFAVATEEYPLPRTVFRPFFVMEHCYEGRAGEQQSIKVSLRNPASETSLLETSGFIYNESVKNRDFVVTGPEVDVKISVDGLPKGAVYEPKNHRIVWTPDKGQEGEWKVTLTADDGLIPEKAVFVWRIYADNN